jgi:hypothetical protein
VANSYGLVLTSTGGVNHVECVKDYHRSRAVFGIVWLYFSNVTHLLIISFSELSAGNFVLSQGN